MASAFVVDEGGERRCRVMRVERRSPLKRNACGGRMGKMQPSLQPSNRRPIVKTARAPRHRALDRSSPARRACCHHRGSPALEECALVKHHKYVGGVMGGNHEELDVGMMAGLKSLMALHAVGACRERRQHGK